MNGKPPERFELGRPIGADTPKIEKRGRKQKPYKRRFMPNYRPQTQEERVKYKENEELLLKPWLDENSGLGRESWDQAPGFTVLSTFRNLCLTDRQLDLTVDFVDKTAPTVLFLVQEALKKIGEEKFVLDQLNDVAEIVKDELLERIRSGEIKV